MAGPLSISSTVGGEGGNGWSLVDELNSRWLRRERLVLGRWVGQLKVKEGTAGNWSINCTVDGDGEKGWSLFDELDSRW